MTAFSRPTTVSTATSKPTSPTIHPRTCSRTGRLERGEHEVLAVGEGEQQQEHDREHGTVAVVPQQHSTVIGRVFDLHGTPNPVRWCSH
jgi:hypothetical protein